MSNEMSRDPVLYEEALCVEGLIAVHGRARDEKGRNLVDATIIMRNVDTSETLEATTNGSGYTFEIVFPRWMQAGDTVEINASYEGRVGGVSFVVPSSPLDMSYDVVIDVGGQFDLPLIILILAIAIVASVVLTSRVMRPRGVETEPEKGDVPPPSNECGICGAEINLGTFSVECSSCGSMYHSACVKGKKRCPSCRKALI